MALVARAKPKRRRVVIPFRRAAQIWIVSGANGRRLLVGDTPPQEQQLYERNIRESSEIRSRAEELEGNRAHELAIAFSGGAISLLLILIVGRVFSAFTRPTSQRGEQFQRVPNV